MIPEYNTANMQDWIEKLEAGQEILLTGKIFAARDAVHKKWMWLLKNGEKLPISFVNTGIYYTGTTPSREDMPIGSCGPTTSSRMDSYYSILANEGLRLTIGKGTRSYEVKALIMKTKGVYLCAIGGAGALYANCVKESKVLLYEELGCEALRELTVEHFPLFVGIDSRGASIFDSKYKGEI